PDCWLGVVIAHAFDLQCTSQLEMLLDPHHVLTCRENCATTGSVFHLRQSRPLADELGDDAFPSLQSPDNGGDRRTCPCQCCFEGCASPGERHAVCRAPPLYQDLVVCCLFGVDLQLAGCALADAASGGVELILGRKGPAVVPVIGAMCGAIGYLYPVGLRRRCS